MPRQTTINKRQMKFVEYIMQGETQTKAAILAGFSEKSAKRHAHDLMRNELVQQEIARQQELQADAIRKAFMYDAYKSQRLLSKIVDKEGAYDRDRIKAAEGILDRAGFRATETPKIDNSTTNVLSGLTEEQLVALINTDKE